jgi:hypothetical protein
MGVYASLIMIVTLCIASTICASLHARATHHLMARALMGAGVTLICSALERLHVSTTTASQTAQSFTAMENSQMSASVCKTLNVSLETVTTIFVEAIMMMMTMMISHGGATYSYQLESC